MVDEIEGIIDDQIEKIVCKDSMMNLEFWYVLVFHNCPDISQKARDNISKIIGKIKSNISNKLQQDYPSYYSISLLCDFLELKLKNGKKPDNSFFNWKGERDFGGIVTYKTFHRTIFKKYNKNTNGLYASIM